MIDNYDSFTYNIVQYLRELGADVEVCRNDELSLQQIRELAPAQIVISPGPCTPAEAGISLAVVREFAGSVPILGICLGHEVVGQVFGGKIVAAQQLMHGKTSLIEHTGEGIFSGLPSPFTVARYHSLVVEKTSLPPSLEVTAWTASHKDDRTQSEIMALRHKKLAIQSVQFHPEAIQSEYGHQLLQNFLNQAV